MIVITGFIQRHLLPAMSDRADVCFPSLGFTQGRGRILWQSPKKLDGSAPRTPRHDKSVITSVMPYRALEQGGESVDLLALYIRINSLTLWEAVKELCGTLGLQAPATSDEDRAKYERQEQKRTALEASAERQRKALFSPKGAATLSYLMGRGWTEEDIRAAGLGYIDEAEAKKIGEEDRRVGKTHTLSIPWRANGTICGFKYRAIDGVTPKYLNTKGLTRKGLFFNSYKDKSFVLVEGELDALHASVRGIKGVVATSGCGLTNDLLDEAERIGVTDITLLLDRDAAGEEFVGKSIRQGYTHGDISVLVAELPDGVKDVDAYLCEYGEAGTDGLKDIIKNAYYGGRWLLCNMVDKAIAEAGDALNDRQSIQLRAAAIRLVNLIPNASERAEVIADYSNSLGISADDFRADCDRHRQRGEERNTREAAALAIKKAQDLLEEGNFDAALMAMAEPSKAKEARSDWDTFNALLEPPTWDGLLDGLRGTPNEIPTAYELTAPNGQKDRLTLPASAITLIVAPTSHGKSTMLQNLALQVAANKEGGDGVVLYFTFEEDANSVAVQMANKHIGIDLCKCWDSRVSTNLRALTHKLKSGEDRYISTDKRQALNDRLSDFQALYESGKMRIIYQDYDSNELCQAIRFLCATLKEKVKAVFVDYIQLLKKADNKKQRTEELKEICKDIKDLAVQSKVPIVIAAQCNREVTSPLEIQNQRIGEAADLERIANKILYLWNSAFKPFKVAKESELDAWCKAHYFEIGEAGKIYVKLTKNRGGVVNGEAVLDYNGNTGVIKSNLSPEVSPQQEQITDDDIINIINKKR